MRGRDLPRACGTDRTEALLTVSQGALCCVMAELRLGSQEKGRGWGGKEGQSTRPRGRTNIVTHTRLGVSVIYLTLRATCSGHCIFRALPPSP